MIGEFLARQKVIDETKPLLRPLYMAVATARLSSTTGDGCIRISRS
jgi:hypothetical protein